MNQQSTTPANVFGTQTKPITNAVANSDEAKAIQEVQAAMVIAKKFPRDAVQAYDRIINACSRPTLAETAIYSYPRGGQDVKGPSIRLAETVAQEWGNLQFGIRELSSENGVSSVEAFAWDLQTNTKQTKTFQVAHVRFTRANGITKLNDPRDIYEVIANQGARRLRACILGVIPGDVIEGAVNQCAVTQASNIDVTPKAIKEMLDLFEKNYGVKKELIEKRIGRRSESITAPQMISLKNIHHSLKDGMSKPWEWFEMDNQEIQSQPKATNLKPTEAK